MFSYTGGPPKPTGYLAAGVRLHTFPAGLLQVRANRSAAIHNRTTPARFKRGGATCSHSPSVRPCNASTPAAALVGRSSRRLSMNCLMMQIVHTSGVPQYLADCVHTVEKSSSRPGLRSADTAAFAKPSTRTQFGEIDSALPDLLPETVSQIALIISLTLVQYLQTSSQNQTI